MKSKRGIALAELVAGFVLLTFFILFSMMMFLNANRTLKETQALTNAMSIMANELEELKITEYDDVVDSTTSITISRSEFDIEIDSTPMTYTPADPEEPLVDYKEVNVTVSYTVKGKNESLSVTTLKINR